MAFERGLKIKGGIEIKMGMEVFQLAGIWDSEGKQKKVRLEKI